jgi:gluconolactonase
MVSEPEKIAEGLFMPEGPVWCDDGTLVVTAVAEGKLYRIWPETRRKAVVADTAGGANGAAAATNGCFLVTQNGGIDFGKSLPGEWPKLRSVSPGLQLARPDGKVIRLVADMQAPNDLVVGPDNTIYFTDPHRFPTPPNSTFARVMARTPDGKVRKVAEGFFFCNGIQREDNGSLVVTEGNGFMRVYLDGRKEWIIEDFKIQHAVDGLCLDIDGRFYLAAGAEHGVRIIDGSKVVDFLPLEGRGATTNCCFGGPDNTWLFATDGLPGDVWMWTDLPTPGQRLHPWKVPPELLQ